MSEAEIKVKGEDRLSVFIQLVDLYRTPGSKTFLKVEGEEGAALISDRAKKVKILTEGWVGVDPGQLSDKNRLI
jgi:hypothetical protein